MHWNLETQTISAICNALHSLHIEPYWKTESPCSLVLGCNGSLKLVLRHLGKARMATIRRHTRVTPVFCLVTAKGPSLHATAPLMRRIRNEHRSTAVLSRTNFGTFIFQISPPFAPLPPTRSLPHTKHETPLSTSSSHLLPRQRL